MTTQTDKKGKEPFANLRALACWELAEKMLADGYTPSEVADFIRGRGEKLEVRRDSLQRQLYRYREKVLKEEAPTSLIAQMVSKSDLEIDDMELITQLVVIQKKRVEKELEIEKMMPVPMASTTKAIVTLFDLIERRVKLLQDSGLKPRVPTRHEHLLGVVGDATLSKMFAGLPPDEREGLRAAIALSGVDEKSVVEGKYREVEPE